MSGSDFGWVGVGQEHGVRRIMWEQGEGPALRGRHVWMRGISMGETGRQIRDLFHLRQV